MGKRRVFAGGALGTLLAGAAAVVVVAGQIGSVGGAADRFYVFTDTSKSTNSKQWKAIPDIFLAQNDAGQTLTLSAQMTKGKAKIRLYNVETDETARPGPVLFSSKASNSFSWGVEDNCPRSYELQWKRAGAEKAVAAKFSIQRISEDAPCL
jgi:hypothetical protein